MLRDRVETEMMNPDRGRAMNDDGPAEFRTNLRLGERLMNDVANLTGCRRIGIMMMPESDGCREKEDHNRDTDRHRPANEGA